MSSSRSIARAAKRGKQAKRRTIGQHLHTFPGRVYVASPIQTYTTACYDTMLARLRELLPSAELIPARDLFASNADWRLRWPRLLPTLDALVFFDHQGSIGRGVFQEIEDAEAMQLPVFYLPHGAADLLPYDGEAVRVLPHGGSWQNYAEVVYLLTPKVLRALGAPDDVVTGCTDLQREKGGA